MPDASEDYIWITDEDKRGFVSNQYTEYLTGVIKRVSSTTHNWKPYIVEDFFQKLGNKFGSVRGRTASSSIYIQDKTGCYSLATPKQQEDLFETCFNLSQAGVSLLSKKRQIDVKEEIQRKRPKTTDQSLKRVLQRAWKKVNKKSEGSSGLRYYKYVLAYEVGEWEKEMLRTFDQLSELPNAALSAPSAARLKFSAKWAVMENELAQILKSMLNDGEHNELNASGVARSHLKVQKTLDGTIEWAREKVSQETLEGLRNLESQMLDIFTGFSSVHKIIGEGTKNPRQDGVWGILSDASESFVTEWEKAETKLIEAIENFFDEAPADSTSILKHMKSRDDEKAQDKRKQKELQVNPPSCTVTGSTSRRRSTKLSSEEQWRYLLESLKSYKSIFGNCEVDLGYVLNGEKLGKWVKEQCLAYHNGKLSEEQLESLRELEFNFSWFLPGSESIPTEQKQDENENGAIQVLNRCDQTAKTQALASKRTTTASDKSSSEDGVSMGHVKDRKKTRQPSNTGYRPLLKIPKFVCSAAKDLGGCRPWKERESKYLEKILRLRDSITVHVPLGFWGTVARYYFLDTRTESALRSKGSKLVQDINQNEAQPQNADDQDWSKKESHYLIAILERSGFQEKDRVFWTRVSIEYFDGDRNGAFLKNMYEKLVREGVVQMKAKEPRKFLRLFPSPTNKRARRRLLRLENQEELFADESSIDAWGLVPHWESHTVASLIELVENEARGEINNDLRSIEFWKKIATKLGGRYSPRELFQKWRYNT